MHRFKWYTYRYLLVVPAHKKFSWPTTGLTPAVHAVISLIRPFPACSNDQRLSVGMPIVNGSSIPSTRRSSQAPTSRFPWKDASHCRSLCQRRCSLSWSQDTPALQEIRTHPISGKGVFLSKRRWQLRLLLNLLFWEKNISLESDNGEKIFKHDWRISNNCIPMTNYSLNWPSASLDKSLYWIIQRELNWSMNLSPMKGR